MNLEAREIGSFYTMLQLDKINFLISIECNRSSDRKYFEIIILAWITFSILHLSIYVMIVSCQESHVTIIENGPHNNVLGRLQTWQNAKV